jgi:hypothetical protein
MTSILLYCRTTWQALEWLREHAGLYEPKLNLCSMTVKVGETLTIYIMLPTCDVNRFIGTNFHLIHFLDPICPIETRNKIYNRLRY